MLYGDRWRAIQGYIGPFERRCKATEGPWKGYVKLRDEPRLFFQLLSELTESESVDVNAFAEGCLKIRQGAYNIPAVYANTPWRFWDDLPSLSFLSWKS